MSKVDGPRNPLGLNDNPWARNSSRRQDDASDASAERAGAQNRLAGSDEPNPMAWDRFMQRWDAKLRRRQESLRASARRPETTPAASRRRAFGERPAFAATLNSQHTLLADLEAQEERTEIDPHSSLYTGAYDGKTLSSDRIEQLFTRPLSTLEWHTARRRIRPDDIRKAREMGLIDDWTAQHLSNRSLDALERAGVDNLPQEIRFTTAGPFYFRLDKDDAPTLRELKVAIGLDPDRRATQTTNAEDNDWDFATLERLRDEGRLEVVDRFGQNVDIFSTTAIDGRQERLVNPKVSYRSLDYEPHEEHGDEKRANALDGDKVMIEAWNHDLSQPNPNMVYEVPAYEWPDGEDRNSDLWRFETLAEPGANGGGRIGHVSGQLNLVKRPRDQIAERLREELGQEPDEETLNAAVKEYDKAKGWAKNRGMEYIRYQKDQTPAGNEAMVDAGMRDPDQGVPYSQSTDRYNGGHVIAASMGGIGEGLNVTAQAEGNNQDRFATFTIQEENGERVYRANESWHDWERHIKNLSRLENDGLTLTQLEDQGFVIPEAVRAKYDADTPIRFEVETSIRSWYEDEARVDEDPSGRHTREFARFTSTRLIDQESGVVIGELLMANYNVGSSDQDYDEKMQMLFDAGFLDANGGYANDADMSSISGSDERAPDVSGAGTLNELLPTAEELRTFVDSEEFRRVWGRNVP